jgi:ATP-binding cassette, subfamily B, bacterial PglK
MVPVIAPQWQYLHEILTLLGEDRRRLPLIVIIFLGASIFDLVGLGLIAPYIAFVMSPENAEFGIFSDLLSNLRIDKTHEQILLVLGFGLVLTFIGKTLASLWIQYTITSFSQNQQVRLRSFLMKSYQSLPYQVYLGRNSSEYIHSIQILVNDYGSVLLTLLNMLSNGLISIVIILILIWQNPLALCALLILIGCLILIFDKMFRKRLRELGRQRNEANHKVVKNIHEAIDGFKELRILGNEAYFRSNLKEGAELISYCSIRERLFSVAPGYFLEALLVFFVVFTIYVLKVSGQDLDQILPTLGVFGLAMIRLKPVAISFAGGLTTMRFSRDSILRLTEDVRFANNMAMNLSYIEGFKFQKNLFKDLKLHNVVFSYQNMQQLALNDISIDIQSGDSIGLIGLSGSGKTTLIDILLGLLEPQSGDVEFNGRRLQENLEEWRSQVAYLPQQVFLIDNSMRCNVALGVKESEIDENRLRQALRQARLSELVEQLPQGMDTILGERGVRLSGGQRQRVALARAFYHSRSVLVMDEATSALDNETEKEIVAEIQRLKGQKTMIVIAHRLTTVQHCDRIYRLEQGRIVEEGTPDQVLKKAS